MKSKRRDNRNRVLQVNESQLKDGRYCYSYYENGKQHKIYSWRLTSSDRVPTGKRACEPLREMIKEIKRRKVLEKPGRRSKMTVLELVEKYIKQKKGVRDTTRVGYKTVTNYLKKDDFAYRLIGDISTSDAKLWLIELQEKGKSYSSIHTIRGVIRPAFRMAVEDEILDRNPFNFELGSVIVNDMVTKEAISKKDEKEFLRFVKQDAHFKKYYEGIYILFKTGIRISELCGLTMDDIDLEERTINVNHQLQRLPDMRYIIQKTKTKKGERIIPMTDEVYKCFKTILARRKKPAREPKVDGMEGFLYLDMNGMPMVALHWENYFKHIVSKYNNTYRAQLPNITPHICRHTYCSNMARAGMNPKTLQYLMGHSDIAVTLDTYTHFTFEDARNEMALMQDNE